MTLASITHPTDSIRFGIVKQFFLLLLFLPFLTFGQESDSVKILDEVTIRAYAYDKPLKDVPAAVAKISSLDLERFSNSNFLPALNTQPGVRMEERSPGSYRLSIRGSSLRSPFGVRNVKVYWNGLPLTDAGGNTYLQSLDFASINDIEIIKGPGSSLYGAGTGGVALFQFQSPPETARLEAMGGSYGFSRLGGGVNLGNQKAKVSISFSDQRSDGYRVQSAMDRQFAQINSHFALGKKTTVSFHGFYSDLFYQTPGGLTLAQYKADPKQARPAGGPFRSAVEQNAHAINKTGFFGFVLEHEWSEKWSGSAQVSQGITDFNNAAIRNYEHRDESTSSARATVNYKFSKGKFSFGAETQNGNFAVKLYQNNSGVQGSLTSFVKAPSNISVAFTQLDLNLPMGVFLTLGASLNQYQIRFDSAAKSLKQSRLVMSPRIALLKKLNQNISVYASVSNGYSPPTFAEVFPSTAVYNSNLKAENGTSTEVGVKGSAGSLSFSVTGYSFNLNSTIVQRRDASGADYFVNAGKTLQQGIEALLSYQNFKTNRVLKNFKAWISYSKNDYQFKDYVQEINGVEIDYSGKMVTGVSPNVASLGLDFNPEKGFYTNVTFNYVDHTPLNDGNSAFAKDYFLAGMRAGYKFGVWKTQWNLFGGIDNAFDKIYSLGNDINAAGNRFYNAAPGRSFYFGLNVKLN
jgi:iron complex outermembrane receptor protein